MKKLLEYLILFPLMIVLYAVVAVLVPTILFAGLYLIGILVVDTLIEPTLSLILADIFVVLLLYRLIKSKALGVSARELWTQIKWNK